MRAGRLRHRVQLQRNTPTQEDAVHDPVANWQTLREVWAAIEPLSGREFLAAQQVQSDMSHRIIIRHYPGLTPRDRVQWIENGSTRVFDIKTVLDRDEKHWEMQLMCTEHHG